MRQSTAWWIEHLRAVGVPCGAVNGVTDALSDAQSQAREMVIRMAHPTAGMLETLGFPMKLTGTPLTAREPPPLLGQHSAEILATELELEPDAIEQLKREGVI